MTLSSIPVSPCRFLLLFVTGILCSIAPLLTNAHRQEEAPAADRIAMDLIKVTDQDQNASFDCWISAVESLLLDERTEPMTSPNHGSDSSYSSCCHQQQSSHTISPAGTSFCSALSNPQKKVLALQLTQCYLEESNRVIFLPESCRIENILLDDDNNGSRRTRTSTSSKSKKNTNIRSCLFDLSSEAFLVYTQFYLLADLACTKLTSELVIRRKLEAVAKFQETALMMEEQVERVFVLQQGIIMDMKEQKDLLERKRVIIQSMNMDIDVARQNMISFKSFVEEQETSMLLLKEMYDRSELKEIWKSFQQMFHSLEKYDGSYVSFVMTRFLLLLSLSFFTILVFPIRRRFVMTLIFVLTLVDVVIESMARHYLELGIFNNNANLHEFLTSQRQKRMDVLVYLVVALLLVSLLLWNSIFSSSSNKTKDLASTNSTITVNGPTAAVITKQDIQDILSSMIELQRMETKQHHEELRQHLVSLQRQLFPCTLETMPPSRRTAEKEVVPQPSSVLRGQHTSTSNMNAPSSSIQGTRLATPITAAAVQDSNSSDHDEDDHRSITIVSSSDKMPIVTPSIRLATRKSCYQQQQQQQPAPIGITIPTSVESPLSSPMQTGSDKHKRKHDCDSDNESSQQQQSSKRQKNNYDSDKDEDDDYNGNSDSSNHCNGNNHNDA